MINARRFFLFSFAILVLGVWGCSADPVTQSAPKFTLGFSSDTMWVWKYNERKVFTVELTSQNGQPVTMSYTNPSTHIPETVQLDPGANVFRILLDDAYYLDTEIVPIKLTVSQSGSSSLETIYLGVGGKKLQVGQESLLTQVSRSQPFTFKLVSDPGVRITWHNTRGNYVRVSEPTGLNGETQITDDLPDDTPLGKWSYFFTAERRNFYPSDTNWTSITVFE